MTSPFGPPICISCIHYRTRSLEYLGPACKAFPDGIPTKITVGGFDHRKPYRGDHGVRWELNPDKAKWLDHYEEDRETLKKLFG